MPVYWCCAGKPTEGKWSKPAVSYPETLNACALITLIYKYRYVPSRHILAGAAAHAPCLTRRNPSVT